VSMQHDGTQGAPDGSFAAVFEQNLGRLKRLVGGMGIGRADAEDVLQDVYLELLQRPGEYRGVQEAANWLLRVTVHRCLREFKRRRRFRRAVTELVWRRAGEPIAAAGADDNLIRQEQLQTVRQALSEIPAPVAALLVLRYFVGLNATQIGEIMQMKAATVRSRLRQGRMALAQRLIKKGTGP